VLRGTVAVPCLHDPMKARHDCVQRPNVGEFTQVVADFHDIENTGWKETGSFYPAGAERHLCPILPPAGTGRNVY